MKRRAFFGALVAFAAGCATGTFEWPDPPKPCTDPEPPKFRGWEADGTHQVSERDIVALFEKIKSETGAVRIAPGDYIVVARRR